MQSGASLTDPDRLPKAKDAQKPRIRFLEEGFNFRGQVEGYWIFYPVTRNVSVGMTFFGKRLPNYLLITP